MYLPYIVDCGVSDADTSIIVNVRGGISLASMFFIHRYYRRLSARTGVFIACLCTAFAYFIYGIADGSFPVYLIGSAFAGVSYAFGSMIIISEILRRWFAKDFNLVIGMAVAGTGVATIIMPLIINAMVETFGLMMSFVYEAIFIAVLSVAVFMLIRDSPGQKGVKPYGVDEGYETEKEVVYRGKTDLPRPVWVRFGFICFVMGYIGGPGLVFLSMLFTSTGSSEAEAAFCISLVGVLMTINKVAIGRMMDKIGRYRSILFFGSILAVGLLMTVLLEQGDVIRYIVIFLMGIGFAMMMICPAAFAKDIALPGQYFDTVRQLEIAYVFGSFVCALLPGMLMTFVGSYVASYLVMAVLLILSLILMVQYYRRNPGIGGASRGPWAVPGIR